MMSSDGNSVRLEDTGSVFGGPSRLVYINYLADDAVGSIVVRDGGATGKVILTIATPDDESAHEVALTVPLRCQTDMHATLTNVPSATFVFV